jgi:hypothetical protein
MATAENAVRTAMITFATSTLPPLITAAHNQALRDGPEYNALNTEAENGLYIALTLYVTRLIAQGAFAGPPLPIR